VTTDDLTPGLPAATRRNALPRLALGLLLTAASLPLAAAPADPAAAKAPAPSSAASIGRDAGAATAAATETAARIAGPASATAVTAPAAAPVEPAPASLSERIQGILATAVTLLGTPYRWGGVTPQSGFDCSGLVGYVFRTTLGIELPRVSRDMAGRGEAVKDRTALTPGDLVFFNLRGRIDHVGIYLGDGRFLHAPRTGRDVRVDSLDAGYWRGRYVHGRRVTQ
jgi:cell wall-associated NlpC family hydrolase